MSTRGYFDRGDRAARSLLLLILFVRSRSLMLASTVTPIGEIVGDVDFDRVLPLVSAITPVPNGVDPMTISMLMANTLTGF